MKSNNTTASHIFAYDYLRVLASIMVVSIHIVDTVTASATNYLGGISWWLANFIQSFSRGSVPIFVLISGALILNKSNVVAKYLNSKTVRRLVVPGIFWITLFFVIQASWHGVTYTPWTIIRDLFVSKISHLYYIYIVIGLYLMTPYIQKWNSKLSLSVVFFLLIISSVLEYIFNRYQIFNPLSTAPLLWVAYLPYYMLGAKLTRVVYNKYLLLGLIVSTVLINAISSYYGYLAVGLGSTPWWMNHNGDYFWSNLSPTVAVLALSLFCLFRQIISSTTSKMNNLAAKVAVYTYGIYLAHPFIIDVFDRVTGLSIDKISHDLWIYFSLKIVGIYILSFILIYILKYFRFGRIIIGES